MRNCLYVRLSATACVASPGDNIRFVRATSATNVEYSFIGDDGGIGTANDSAANTQIDIDIDGTTHPYQPTLNFTLVNFLYLKGFFKEEERIGCSYTLKRFMDKMKTYSDKKNYSCFSRIKKSETTEMLKRIGEERRNLFLKIFNEDRRTIHIELGYTTQEAAAPATEEAPETEKK